MRAFQGDSQPNLPLIYQQHKPNIALFCLCNFAKIAPKTRGLQVQFIKNDLIQKINRIVSKNQGK